MIVWALQSKMLQKKKTELSSFWPKGADTGLLTLDSLERLQDMSMQSTQKWGGGGGREKAGTWF